MKTAVSIPTPLFEQAEQKARKLGISRSQLYARALEKLLKDDEERRQAITAELNEVYDKIDSSMDPVLHEMQRRTIAKHSEW